MDHRNLRGRGADPSRQPLDSVPPQADFTIMSNVHTLAESNAEALRALESLSQRLGDIFVNPNLNEGTPSSGTPFNGNGNGKLVNEEGLPFVEIMEPLDELDTPSLTTASDEIVNDHYPEPLLKLSEEALALNRQRRDKILQMLEEEEEREERRTKEQRKEELQRQRQLARHEMEKRMLNQGFELEKRRKAKELELRMAKALVGNSSNKPKSTTSPEKKKVTFAEPEKRSRSDSVQPNSRLTLPASRQPMKMQVIERAPVPSPHPTSSAKHEPRRQTVKEQPSQSLETFPKDSPSLPTITFMNCDRDSDDESDPDENIDPIVPMESTDKDVSMPAEMHRELTLEYQKRRAALKFDPGDVLNQLDSSKWNQEDVPLKASLAQPPPKPSVSKFKESRIKQRVPKPSTTGVGTTFETTIIPPEILANSIRMGKVMNGQLVTNDEEMD